MENIIQHPQPGSHGLYFCGDEILFSLELPQPIAGKAYLRTNLNRADIRHQQIVDQAEADMPSLERDWYDLPMDEVSSTQFTLRCALYEVGRFEAKLYYQTEDGELLWPKGTNSIIKVEPADTYCSNTLYTAFVRLFGHAKQQGAITPEQQTLIEQLDDQGYHVLPPSGTFRDLIEQLDFIIGRLRCRIVQLLPIHPTPTTYARMGRYGSPFAALDLFDVDPALAEFDRATTPLDQFQELIDAIHHRDGRIYMDMPINHTGWASHLQNHHPEWFARSHDDEEFASPGAWGITWEDLSKLDFNHRALWSYMASVFLFWCERGVDGFRCDAGYKIPFEAWKYIIAKVRLSYPDTVFLLEGLGGAPEVTEQLLADAGMNWAYSEIFQNYDRSALEHYLPNSLQVAATKGNLIHFSETHDNARLAAQSIPFARLRTALCALSALNGTTGFSNGVEWYADQQLNVHNAHSLNWGNQPNQIEWIERIHALLEIHPAFHPGARIECVTQGKGEQFALQRIDATEQHPLLILANLDCKKSLTITHPLGDFDTDLLTGQPVSKRLGPGEVCCLSKERSWADKLDQQLQRPFNGSSQCEEQRWRAKLMELAAYLDLPLPRESRACRENPHRFLSNWSPRPCVVCWDDPHDIHRTVMLPYGNVLVIRAAQRFRASLCHESTIFASEKSLRLDNGEFVALICAPEIGDAHRAYRLTLTLYSSDRSAHKEASILGLMHAQHTHIQLIEKSHSLDDPRRHAICANQRGTLCHMRVHWSDIQSKYDGILQANLHPSVPTDRHLMFTRARAWIVHKGFSRALNKETQSHFSYHPSGMMQWHFTVPVGDERTIQLVISMHMHPTENAIALSFQRLKTDALTELNGDEPICLIIRPDLEDRTNHTVTRSSEGLAAHFLHALQSHPDGCLFAPDADRALKLALKGGQFNAAPEWTYQVEHPVDRDRAIDGASDLFSPGYFQINLMGKQTCVLEASVNTEATCPPLPQIDTTPVEMKLLLKQAMQAYIVQRDELKTVIAGYPWFLDWGRDTLICLRGIIAAGFLDEAEAILLQFARFERSGTLPNMISGENDNNRETSDAPLWFFVACHDLLEQRKADRLLDQDCGGRTLKEVLISIVEGYLNGTENGIHVDKKSGLVFSPSHYTWMDTNYPAGTPREGYPIEIQALWVFAVEFLYELTGSTRWKELAALVRESILSHYLIETEHLTYLADNLAAAAGQCAAQAHCDDALRSNQLFAITLGAIQEPSLCRSILQSCERLLVPGAIRSLADQPVRHAAGVYHDGQLLNDPHYPYKGNYWGDEDTSRKPAYHNGTAWGWPFPSYAEALLLLYGNHGENKARAILQSASLRLTSGCLGQLPEITDGNSPHTARGCGAQAWSVTELYRVLSLV